VGAVPVVLKPQLHGLALAFETCRPAQKP
jgi:hypothetical protein